MRNARLVTRSLREEHVRQTRAALIGAARHLFASSGYTATSVGQIASRAGVTVGALYHHFDTKAALFEAVFEDVHRELLGVSVRAAASGRDPLDALGQAFEAWLDAVLDPGLQRIAIVDATAVLGLARFIELDERYAVGAIVATLETAREAGIVATAAPDTTARLLVGALMRGAMLVVSSDQPRQTRDAIALSMRELIAGLSPPAGDRRS